MAGCSGWEPGVVRLYVDKRGMETCVSPAVTCESPVRRCLADTHKRPQVSQVSRRPVQDFKGVL